MSDEKWLTEFYFICIGVITNDKLLARRYAGMDPRRSVGAGDEVDMKKVEKVFMKGDNK